MLGATGSDPSLSRPRCPSARRYTRPHIEAVCGSHIGAIAGEDSREGCDGGMCLLPKFLILQLRIGKSTTRLHAWFEFASGEDQSAVCRNGISTHALQTQFCLIHQAGFHVLGCRPKPPGHALLPEDLEVNNVLNPLLAGSDKSSG